MIKIKNIEFEQYYGAAKIVSCTNKKSKIRIASRPATVLHELMREPDKFQDKKVICRRIFGRHDLYVGRTFDVYLAGVKKILKGTDYEIRTGRLKVGIFHKDTAVTS